MQVQSIPTPEYSDAWGRIVLTVVDASESIILLDAQWDMLELAAWFVDNRGYVCNQALLIEGDEAWEGESWAKTMDRFHNKDFRSPEEFDVWHQRLDESDLLTRHSIASYLKGAAVPHILIGCNRGLGEISHVQMIPDPYTGQSQYHKWGDWCYHVDLDAFLKEASAEILSFLHQIQAQVIEPERQAVVQQCITELTYGVPPKGCCMTPASAGS